MCEHVRRIPTRKTNSDGRVIVSLQCQECGRSLAAKHSDFNLEELPPFDLTIQQRYTDKIIAEYTEKNRKFLEERALHTGAWWEKYKAYLLSGHWKTVRQAVLGRDRFCQRCFKNPSDQAHHLTYDTFSKHGFSFPAECVGICQFCHKLLHPES